MKNIIKSTLIISTSIFTYPALSVNMDVSSTVDIKSIESVESSNKSSHNKADAVNAYREYFAKTPYRNKDVKNGDWKKCVSLLQSDGRFSDLRDEDAGKAMAGNNADSGGSITDGLNRVWIISEAFRSKDLNVKDDIEIWDKCQKSILHYGKLELQRPNNSRRFHSSCFAIPTAAVNIYFCHLKSMDDVEQGRTDDKQLAETCEMLKALGFQAWSQPYRDDETDKNIVSVDRFRKHVWWVGGNALGYRSLLPVAFMMRSVPMVDVLSEVCQKAISCTSQNTYEESFWNEGFTADGAGWGHGKQCLIWGYPIDGTLSALNMLSMLKDSPWEQKLTQENKDALFNYFRGSNFYYYKGYTLPCLDRGSMQYKAKKGSIRYDKMLNQLINDWSDSFSSQELSEMKQLYAETKNNSISMPGYDKKYNGAKWFFNNDNLIKKNDNYHIIVNMASNRCDGLESAHTFADAYNFYTADGVTLFQKSGDEYRNVLGAFDVTAFPGITAREGMEYLKPVTNWRGYCSIHNFAAAATSGGGNAAGGFIFEKMNGSEKNDVNDRGNSSKENEILYGVKAYKSYFMIGDYMVALGAGINNLNSELKGNIRTTIEQTEKTCNVYELKGKNGVSWIVQDGKFAYSAFPEYKNKVHYSCETRKTDWVKRNPANKKLKNLPQEVEVFNMWLDHGQNVKDDSYGYVVYSGDGIPDKKYPFEVLRNDTTIQSVISSDRKVLGALFYDSSAELKTKDVVLSVSAPCAVLIEKQGKENILSVTDALMNPDCNNITVKWNGRIIECEMPQGIELGKPMVIKL